MYVSDAEIERAIRKRLSAPEELPVILMPFDPEAENSNSDVYNVVKMAV